eukprot:gene30384-37588_t
MSTNSGKFFGENLTTERTLPDNGLDINRSIRVV